MVVAIATYKFPTYILTYLQTISAIFTLQPLVTYIVLSSFSHAQTIGNGVISSMYDACIT